VVSLALLATDVLIIDSLVAYGGRGSIEREPSRTGDHHRGQFSTGAQGQHSTGL
jgi:hypothetical protein